MTLPSNPLPNVASDGQIAKSRAVEREQHDLAYLFFLPPAAICMLALLGSIVVTDTSTAAGLGFFILIPLAMISLFTVPIGIWYSCKLRKDRALPLLSILTTLVVTGLITEAAPVAVYNMVIPLYAALVFILEAHWFMFKRKSTYPDHPEAPRSADSSL